MRAPRPDCPHCHGAGDIEHVLRMVVDGKLEVVGYEYSPCPCAYTRTELEEAEDNA